MLVALKSGAQNFDTCWAGRVNSVRAAWDQFSERRALSDVTCHVAEAICDC
jgi:hypothetical protein